MVLARHLAILSFPFFVWGCAPSFAPSANLQGSNGSLGAVIAPEVDLGADRTYTSASSESIVQQNKLEIVADVRNGDERDRFEWTQISGPTPLAFEVGASGAVALHNITYGTYVIHLRVVGDKGQAGEGRLKISLIQPGQNPTPTPTPTPTPRATPTPMPAPTPTSSAPVIVMSTTGKLTVRPRSTSPRPTDWVGSGTDFALQGVVLDDGKVVDCRWKQLGGPTSLTFSKQYTSPEPANADGTASGNVYCGAWMKNYQHGTYTLEIEATDDAGLKSRSTVELTFPVYGQLTDGPQVVSDSSVGERILPPNFAKSTVESPSGYTIAASYYTDALRDFDVRQLSGPNVSAIRNKAIQYGGLSSAIQRITYGTYDYQFEITDTQGRKKIESSKVVFLKPIAGAQGPNVSAPVHPQIFSSRNGDVVYATAGDIRSEFVPLDVSAYYDSLPTNFNWRQVSGPTFVNFTFKVLDAGMVTAHGNNLNYGTYVFEGSLADELGNQRIETLKVTYPQPITATGVNQTPRVTLSADGAITVRPNCYQSGPVNHIESKQDFSFQGVAYDDGTIASFKWTQMSGPTQLSLVNEYSNGSYYGLRFRNHTYGTYELKLEVTDDKGLKGFDTVKITFPRGI